MDTAPGCAVGDLIVILQVADERPRRKIQGRRSAPVALPAIVLALIQKPALDRRNDLLGRPEIVAVVRFPATCQSHQRAVMEVVVPERVQSITPVSRRAYELSLLRL